jgi:hypothetical protein
MARQTDEENYSPVRVLFQNGQWMVPFEQRPPNWQDIGKQSNPPPARPANVSIRSEAEILARWPQEALDLPWE